MATKRKLTDFTPDNRNANKGSVRGLAMLEDSLRKYGAGRSILVDKHNRIIAGNKTAETAVDIGLTDAIVVPTDGKQLVVVQRVDVDLDTPAGRELAIADNRTGEVSLAWDAEVLAALAGEGVDLAPFFDDDELAALLADVAGEPPADPGAQVDKAEELQAKWQVLKGDLWTIGNHRLLCGDSTRREDVQRVMAGERADMVFTDPPYKVEHYGGGFSQKEIRQDFKDKLAPLTEFNPASFLSVLTDIEWQSAIIFTSKDLLPIYFEWVKDYDFNLFVWHKSNVPPFTNNTFLPDLEYMVVAHKPNKIHNSGLDYEDYSRCFTSDIHEGKDNVLASHPTMKPVALMARYIKVLSAANGLVLDPFIGSGTTLVACEQTGRKGRGIEIEPKYVSVALERLSQMGLSPVRVETR